MSVADLKALFPANANDFTGPETGTPGTQTAAFLAGVSGVPIAGPTQTVLVNSSGQLGTAISSSATACSR